MRRPSHALVVTLVITLITLVAGCGINPDRTPRDIRADERRSLIDTPTANQPRPGTTARIFLLAPSEQGATTKLRPVGRDVDAEPTDVLRTLLDGLTPEDQQDRLRTAIPSGTQLLSAELVDSRTLGVDVSSEFFGTSGEALTDAIAQIVFTTYGVDNELSVLLSVEGVAQEWPIGSGSLVSRPLSVFDYPDRNPTSQPDYPSLPSPGAQAAVDTGG
ncbi:MAG: GerMN domain-containing protein [Acidimicrobiia bacterium]